LSLYQTTQVDDTSGSFRADKAPAILSVTSTFGIMAEDLKMELVVLQTIG